MLEHYLSLATRAIFVENMALAFFLGMCSFLAISKNVFNAIGMGAAVVVVLALTCPLNNISSPCASIAEICSRRCWLHHISSGYHFHLSFDEEYRSGISALFDD